MKKIFAVFVVDEGSFVCYNEFIIRKGAEEETMENERKLLSEEEIMAYVRAYLTNPANGGNWHDEKTRQAGLRERGVDLYFVGGKRNGERFLVECKKQYTGNGRETWLAALGQIVTRLNVSGSRGKNEFVLPASYRYGLGLHKDMAATALRRIPKAAAQILNLYIFSVSDDGYVKKWSPGQFGRRYASSLFERPVSVETSPQ